MGGNRRECIVNCAQGKIQVKNGGLRKFLCDTYPKRLGEASLNLKWGIGMSLTNDDVLDTTKWKEEGNRLGKALEVVREELRQEHSH